MRALLRFVLLAGLVSLLLLVAVPAASSGGFEPMEWDNGTVVDFGYGEVSYLSCPDPETTPCPEVQANFVETK